MPRTSRRQKVLNRLDEIIAAAVKHHRLLELCGDRDNSRTRKDFITHCVFVRKELLNSRCMFRKVRHRRRKAKFNLCLDCGHDEALTEKEFKFHFRLCRDSFWQLVSLTENNEVFKKRMSDSRGKFPPLPAHQLLVLLKCLGSEGNAASSISLGNFFGIAHGLIDVYRLRAMEAVLSLESRTCLWLSTEERKAIANRIKEKHYFPHCVGITVVGIISFSGDPIHQDIQRSITLPWNLPLCLRSFLGCFLNCLEYLFLVGKPFVVASLGAKHNGAILLIIFCWPLMRLNLMVIQKQCAAVLVHSSSATFSPAVEEILLRVRAPL